jgi:hypothetical protein
MAIVAISPQDISNAGVAPSYTGSLSTSNSYTVSNDGRVFLHFKKTGVGACTVTVTRPAVYKGAAIAAQTFVVPATTGDVMFGPLNTDLYNDGNGNVTFTPSDVTGLTVAALHLPPA